MSTRSQYPRMVTALLALVGLLDALYLSVERLRQGAFLICPTGGGCETVQNSPYSVILGVPVAFMGVAACLALLLLALLSLNFDRVGDIGIVSALLGRILPTQSPLLRSVNELWITTLILAASSFGVLFSLYLNYLQLFVIHAICFWCEVSAVCQLGIWIAALIDRRMLRASQKPPRQQKTQAVT